MPRGHEHDPILAQYLPVLFEAIFLNVLLEYDCNGKTYRCAVLV